MTIRMYGAEWCSDCKRSKLYFDKQGIEYEYIDIDAEPERYKHYFERDVPEKYRSRVDVRAFSPGERLVFEPYTREAFTESREWIAAHGIFAPGEMGSGNYEEAVLSVPA